MSIMRSGAAFICCLAGIAVAQEAAEFDVASVKPHVAQSAGGNGEVLRMMRGMAGGCGPSRALPGRFEVHGMSLEALIACAYGVQPFQVSGPAWMQSETYDISARMPVNTDLERFRAMLQKLLTDRFRMTVHRDSKDLPSYTLVVAKGGPKLMAAEEAKAPAADAAAQQQQTQQQATKALAEAMAHAKASMTPGGTPGPSRSFHMPRATMGRLAEMLARNLDAPVVDDTGIEGEHAISLEWSPESAASEAGPTIFEAVQQQLGLKLERQKKAVETIVVDRAEKVPVGN